MALILIGGHDVVLCMCVVISFNGRIIMNIIPYYVVGFVLAFSYFLTDSYEMTTRNEKRRNIPGGGWE